MMNKGELPVKVKRCTENGVDEKTEI